MGSCCLLKGYGSPQGLYLRRQISVPLKSHAPISPLASKNQTYLPSVTGVGDVESLYAYIIGLLAGPSSFTDQSTLPVRASMQWPRIVPLNLGSPSWYSAKVVRKRRSPQTAI